MTVPNTHEISLKSPISATAEEVFNWHKQEGAFIRLMPPWGDVKITRMDSGIINGNKVYLKVKPAFFQHDWIAELSDVQEGCKFVDTQVKGPFEYWQHQHLFQNTASEHSFIEDIITYRVKFGFIGDAITDGFVCRHIDRLLGYRHRTIENDLLRIKRFPNAPSLRIAVIGGTGLIGSALIPFLRCAGHRVHIVTRHKPNHPTDIFWDPGQGMPNSEQLENFDAIVNLAGENIGSGRWSAARKERLRTSRIDTTHQLVQACSKLSHPPKVLINASAIGYYGDRGDELLDEDSSKGKGFLSDICEAWEKTATQLTTSRVACVRFGMVLSPKGGALKQMLTPFRLGVGGKIGSGQQYYSWIGIDDAIYQLYNVMMDQRLSGPINIVSPQPVSNEEFTRVLGKVLGRPTLLTVPAKIIRVMFGEMGDALLLSSTKVLPKKLASQLYPFAYADLETCLRHMLGIMSSES